MKDYIIVNYRLHSTPIQSRDDLFRHIVVYKDKKLYCPAKQTNSPASGELCFYVSNKKWQCVNVLPKMFIRYVDHYRENNPYATLPEVYGTIQISDLDDNYIGHDSINNNIDLQYQASDCSWTTVLRLPAGATVVNNSDVRTNSTTFRLKIGSWTSSAFSLSDSYGTVSRDIPEAQWGV